MPPTPNTLTIIDTGQTDNVNMKSTHKKANTKQKSAKILRNRTRNYQIKTNDNMNSNTIDTNTLIDMNTDQEKIERESRKNQEFYTSKRKGL